MNKVLIFDFDGTLADSFVTLLETFEEIAARKAGVKILSVGWGFNRASILKDHNPDMFAQTPTELTNALEAFKTK
jgi:phosphoglycolate phosphatase-like HAD superfamily hydrolase